MESSLTRWARRVLGLVLVLIAGIVVLAFSIALRTERPVGFQLIEIADPGGPPLEVGVWYPSDSTPLPTTLLGFQLTAVAPNGRLAGQSLPLVLISHGNGGGAGSHIDLALALAENGFVVAAPVHTGDNYRDQSFVGSARWLVDRSRHIRSVIDYMLKSWTGHARIDAGRIGIFGFSAGGFTALTVIGGEPDLRVIGAHCLAQPEFVCKLLADANAPLMRPENAPSTNEFVRDLRVKAAIIAAPGLGFTFLPNGLSKVMVPVQLWAGEADSVVPYATNSGPVRGALGSKVDFHAVAHAGHFSFLAPCGLLGPPVLCKDADGFDREALHSRMNAQAVEFFQRNL